MLPSFTSLIIDVTWGGAREGKCSCDIFVPKNSFSLATELKRDKKKHLQNDSLGGVEKKLNQSSVYFFTPP